MAEKYYYLEHVPIVGGTNYWSLPSNFYGHTTEGYTAYWFGKNPSDGQYAVKVGTGLVSNDVIDGANHSDIFFGAFGNDWLLGHDHNDRLVGGSGDDQLEGEDDNDILLGDWANAPLINGPNGHNWDIPAEDPSLSGNDKIYGGKGADIIIGGPGNDQIDAGPRGQGNLDDVTGGPGADMFMLSYNNPGDPETQSAFWDSFGGDAAQTATSTFVDLALEKLGEAALQAAFGEITGSGLLLGPLGAVGGELASSALGLLFNSPKSPPPKGEDLLVIRDFDPREDVLVLPIDVNKSLYSNVTYLSNSAVDGNNTKYPELKLTNLDGWALEFGHANSNGSFVVYAQVFLSPDYVKALGLSSNPGDARTKAALEAVLDTATVVGANGLTDKDGNSTDTQAYALSGIDMADQPDWQPAPGTQTMIFGALGPMTIFGPQDAGLSNVGMLLGGSNFGDIITANAVLLPPDQVANQAGITNIDSEIFGFGGNDYLYGGNAQDTLWGGDGDDHLYAFGNQAPNSNGNQYNRLHGDAGDDVLVSGSGTSAIDGGEGYDTVSYALAANAMTIDLSTPPDFNDATKKHNFSGIEADFPGVVFTGHATDGITTNNIIHYDALANIEGVIGSAHDDVITGNGLDNTVDPGLGNDTITGNGGSNTISYRSAVAAVTIDLVHQTTAKSDGAGTNYVDHYTGFVNAYGSDFDDVITGTSGDNLIDPGLAATTGDQINGNGGSDTIAYFSALSGVTVDLHIAQATKMSADGKTTFTDTFASIENIIGSSFDDSFLRGNNNDNVFFYSAGNDYLDGIGGTDTLDYKDARGAVTIDVTTQKTTKTIDNGGKPPSDDGIDTFKDIEVFVGSTYDDTIIGGHFSDGSGSTAVALGLPTATTYAGGAGEDTFVVKGSIGDVDIAADFSEIASTSARSLITQFEWLRFDEFTVELAKFDRAITNRQGDELIKGTGGRELIVGHKTADDNLRGAQGDDALLGLGGDDLIRGNRGMDFVLGGQGDDGLFGGNGRDLVKGGIGADLVSGGGGKDVVRGGNGADLLSGGARNDKLVGGHGKDGFLFDAKLKHNVDTVADFRGGEKIVLDHRIFAALDVGTLARDMFAHGKKANDSSDHILYDRDTGIVRYDADGFGGHKAIKFARLGNHFDLGHDDIVIA